MSLVERIESFSVLGDTLRSALVNDGRHAEELTKLIEKQGVVNPWFTPENVRFALEAIASGLTRKNLEKWTSSYHFPADDKEYITTGLVFAGNIPLAGFHDFLCVLISGNRLVAKTSAKDPDLIPYIYNVLCGINPEFTGRALFTAGAIAGFDTVIATGSNNSSRYFEYYFGKYPHIIRKNRNSIAILGGNETKAELNALGKDIFTYFGLGCRNVSKIYVPAGYDTSILPSYWEEYSPAADNSRYANNYDYNKAIYLVGRQKFHDGGFIMLKEDKRLYSPVSVLHFEYYNSSDQLGQETSHLKNEIQCVVSRKDVPFGESQAPHLWDYADDCDTLDFLLKKNIAGIS